MCLLTPPGEGGIGIVALWGPGAPPILSRTFRGTRRGADELPPGRIAHGTVRRGDEILDEVILARLAPPYPGAEPPYFEVNCHGGVVAVRAVMELLAAEGAEPSEVAGRTSGQPPLAPGRMRQDALEGLARVPTRLGALMLLHQANGALAAALDEVRAKLTAGEAGESGRLLAELLATSSLGLDLLTPPRVALLGPPNAGKSTLLNALLQEERVIVHHEPGTTRDVIVERVSVRGMPFDLMDSAGIRETTDEVEAEAVRRATLLAQTCDVALIVFDASPGSEPDLTGIPATAAEARVVLVANKIDLLEGAAPATASRDPLVAVSALESTGIDLLEEALLEPYRDLIEECRAGAGMIFTDAQKGAVESVRAALADGGCGRALQELGAAGLPGEGSEPEAGHDEVEQRPRAEGHEEHDA